MQKVLKDIDSSNLGSAVSRLRKLFADDPLGTLRVLREKEVLLRSTDPRVRQYLREIVLELLADPGLTDDVLPTIL
ncbi:MAG TPA: hypothetical protein VH394_19185, partial [Thermoanaerobaculia bacterium]|nr:hypothetical protein [Thermoanaerobaculia bacterium]